MENQTLTTGATPSPVNNQPTDGAPNPFKKVILALAALLVVGGVGAGVYLNMGPAPSQGDPNEPPPSLSAAGGLKGSFVESLQGFLQYNAQDVTDFAKVKPGLATKFGTPAFIRGNAMINYMSVGADNYTMADFVNNNSPVVDGNRALFLVYSAGQGNLSKGFHTYPAGPFGTLTTEIKKEDLSKITLARNSGVIMISRANGENYGVLSANTAPTSAAFPTPLLPDDKSGWVLVAGNGKLSDLLGASKDRVISTWALKDIGNSENNTAKDFEKVDMNTYAFSAYHLAWVNLLPKSAVVDPTPTAVAPKIATVSPGSITEGEVGTLIAVTGTDLKNVNKVEFKEADVSVNPATVTVTDTKITFKVSSASQSVGMKTLTLTAKDGSSVTSKDKFQVVSKTKITSVSPTSLMQGQKSAVITINGTNLTSATVQLAPDTNFSFIGNPTTNATGTATNLTVDVADAAVKGAVAITVTTPNGSVTDSTLMIVEKGSTNPVITKVEPSFGTQGDNAKEITITGTNLLGATVTSAQDMTIVSQTVATATSLTFKINIAASALAGINKSITITKAGLTPVVDKSFEIKALPPQGPAAGTAVIGSEVLALAPSVDGPAGYPGTYNGSEYQWVKGKIQNIGSLYDVVLSEGAKAGKLVYLDKNHLAAMATPTVPLVVGQKVIAKSRVATQNTFWSATITKVDGANYTFGYDDETNKPEVRTIGNFFVPLSGVTIVTPVTPPSAALSITSTTATPNSLAAGEKSALLIKGLNLLGATLSGPNLTFSIPVIDSVQNLISATVTVNAGAAAGTRDITITTATGTYVWKNALTITVPDANDGWKATLIE